MLLVERLQFTTSYSWQHHYSICIYCVVVQVILCSFVNGQRFIQFINSRLNPWRDIFISINSTCLGISKLSSHITMHRIEWVISPIFSQKGWPISIRLPSPVLETPAILQLFERSGGLLDFEGRSGISLKWS